MFPNQLYIIRAPNGSMGITVDDTVAQMAANVGAIIPAFSNVTNVEELHRFVYNDEQVHADRQFDADANDA